MSSSNRRVFLMRSAAVAASLCLAGEAAAQAKLDPKDPQAVALGYVDNTASANQAKYPNHAASQMCSNCQLYQGKPGDAGGPCPIYSGKVVNAKGWCSAYAKKA